MFCTRNQEQLEQFYQYLTLQILTQIKNDVVFDIKSFAKALYEEMYEKTNNNTELSMTYVSLLPLFVQSIMLDTEISKYFSKKGINITEINNLRHDWSDFEKLKTSLNIVDTKEQQAGFKVEIEDANTIKNGNTSDTDYEEVEKFEVTASQNRFQLKRENPYGSTDQDTIDETTEDLDNSDLTKIVFRNTRKKLKELAETQGKSYDSVELTKPDGKTKHVGVATKLISNKDLPEKFLRKKTIERGMKDVPGVYVVITDTQGNFLYFDNDGNLSDVNNGTLAYTFLNAVKQVTKPNGEVVYDLTYTYNGEYKLISPEELALKDKPKNEQAYKNLISSYYRTQQKQLKYIYDLRKYIIESEQSIIIPINNITDGIFPIDFNNLSPLSDLSYDLNFKFKTVANFEKEVGALYYDIPGVIEDVLVMRPVVSQDIAKNIIDLLVYANNTKQNIEDIRKYIEILVYTNPKNFQLNIKDGKLLIRFNPKNTGFTEDVKRFVVDVNVKNKADLEALELFLTTSKKLNIDKSSLNNVIDFLNIENGQLKKTKQDYNTFIKNNFLTYIKPNSEGKIQSNNAYINLDFDSTQNFEEKLKTYTKDLRKSYNETVSKTLKNSLKNNRLHTKLKSVANAATPEQIEAAKLWWSKHPLSAKVPFRVMMDVVNNEALAQFTNDGITLFNGANYTDLYHEAFHAFTQWFLKEEERTTLYDELRTLSGSFKDEQGIDILFSEAEDKQLEEYLAEDFRKYVLSGRKLILTDRPVRNTLFRRIIKALQEIVNYFTNGKKSVEDKIQDIYENLYNGKINTTKVTDNYNFIKFNKIKVGDKVFSAADTKLILDSIDSYIAFAIEDVPPTTFFENPSNIQKVFEGFKQFAQDGINSDYYLRSQKDLLQDVLNNFEGVKKYYLERSKYLSDINLSKVFFDKNGELIEDFDEDGFDGSEQALNKGRDTLGSKNGNEQSIKDLANKETMLLLKTIIKDDEYNEFGLPLLYDFNTTWNRVIKITQGSTSRKDMYNKLVEASREYKEIAKLVVKLGDPDAKETNENQLSYLQWSKFYQDFDKTRIGLQIGLIKKEDNGIKYILSEADPSLEEVENDFNAHFASTRTEYTLQNDRGILYLNVPKIINDFAKPSKTGYVINTNDNRIPFLKAIGFNIETDNVLVKEGIKNLPDYVFSYIITGIANLHKAGKQITQPVKDLSKTYSKDGKQLFAGEALNVKKILQVQAKYADAYSNYSVVNPNGDREYEHSLNNFMSKTINLINSANHYTDILKNDILKQYDVDFNHFITNSKWLNSLFVLDVSKDNTRYGTRRLDTNGNRVTIELVNYSGLRTIEEIENEGSKTTDLNREAKFLMDVHSLLLHGVIELPRHASKNSSFAIKISEKNNYKSNQKHLLVGINEFLDTSLLPDTAKEILHGYIKDELAAIIKFNNGVGKDLSIYSKNGGKFRLFDDILTNKDKLINEAKTLDDIDNIIEKNMSSINKDLENYFRELIKTNINIFKQSPVLSYNLRDFVSKNRSPLNKKDSVDLLALKVYSVNSWLQQAEAIKFIYGDPAYFELLKEEFHKRNTAYSATGNMPLTDDAALDYINKFKQREYAKKEGFKHIPYSRWVRTIIFDDPKIGQKSALYDELEKEWVEELIKTKGLTSEQAKQEAAQILSPYLDMKESDAQGHITFDFYRAYKTLLGQWGAAEEKLYQELLYPDTNMIDRLGLEEYKKLQRVKAIKLFTPLKLQYLGILKHDSLVPPAFHKYSVVPLIPQLIEGTPLEDINRKMMKEGIDYSVFASGSKLAGIQKGGKFNQFYIDDTRLPNVSSEPYTVNEIALDFLKEQVKIEAKLKGHQIFSTQLRKLVLSGLFDSGKPLTEQMSNLSNEYESNINELTQLRKEELFKETGIKYENGEYVIEDFKPLVEIIAKELIKRDMPDNVIDFINTIENQKTLENPLDLSTKVQVIETLLNAIVNNRLVRQYMNGEPLIQVASTGFESKESTLKYTNPTQNDLDKWGTNDLPFYRPRKITRNGKVVTSAMKIKVALIGDFEKLLDLPEVIRLSEEQNIPKIKALNQLIKSEEWLNKDDNRNLITMVGVRIPVQGANSMEFMEVYEFLPPAAGNIIIPPTQIVAKSGGDFDIDKLNVFRPNIVTKDGKLVLAKKSDSFYNLSEEELHNLYTQKIQEQKDKMTAFFNELNKEFTKKVEDSVLSKEDKDYILNLKKEYYKELDELQQSADVFQTLYVTSYLKEKPNLTEVNDFYEQWYNTRQKITILNKNYFDSLKQYKNIFIDEYIKGAEGLSAKIQNLYDEQRSLRNFKVKSVENAIIDNIRSILELPEMFFDLTRPNDTGIVKPLADELEDEVSQYNASYSYLNKGNVVINKSTRETKLKSDLTSEEKKSGKWVKYVSATRLVEPAYNLYKHTSNNEGKGILGILAIDNTFHALFKRTGAYLNKGYYTKSIVDGQEVTKYNPINIYFDHNKTTDGNIDLSRTYNVSGIKIADIISQLINGSVDVEKDAWISNINGTMEAIPVLSLLVSAGVDFTLAVKFVTNPIILEYTRGLKAKNNLFNKLSTDVDSDNYKRNLQYNLFNKLNVKTNKGKELNLQYFSVKNLGITTSQEMFTEEGLRNPDNYAALLKNFIELEGAATQLTDVKRALNFDTNKTSNSFAALQKVDKMNDVLSAKLLSDETLNKLRNETVISSFAVQPLSLAIWEKVLPLRYNPYINNFIAKKIKQDIPFKKRALNSEKFARTFKNDFIQYLFQNKVLTSYNSLNNNIQEWFVGNNTVAKQFYKLIEDYPFLLENFKLVQDLKLDKSENDKIPFDNLKINKPLNDTDLVNLYVEEFEKLISYDFVKTDVTEDNKRITLFFRNLAIFGFLQSGLNKSSISFTEIIPQEVYTGIMKDVINKVTTNINADLLNDFYSRFKVYNPQFFKYSKDSLQETQRFKNYTVNGGKEAFTNLLDSTNMFGLSKTFVPEIFNDENVDTEDNQEPVIETNMNLNTKLHNLGLRDLKISDNIFNAPIKGISKEAVFRGILLQIVENPTTLKDIDFTKYLSKEDIEKINSIKSVAEEFGNLNMILNQNDNQQLKNYVKLNTDLNNFIITVFTPYLKQFGEEVKFETVNLRDVDLNQPKSQKPVNNQPTINIYNMDKNGFEKLSNLLTNRVKEVVKNSKGELVEVNFKTVEHAYQTKKAIFAGDFVAANKIMKAESGFEAQTMGGKNKGIIKGLDSKKWDKIAYNELQKTMSLLYNQDVEMRNLLLSTGNAQLTHKATTNVDLKRWGNDFPEILMNIRKELSNNSIAKTVTDFTNHSGGAAKYDTYWDNIGKEFGIKNHIHYTVAEYDKLSEQIKNKYDKLYQTVAKWLGRGLLDKDSYAGKLVRRDMIQAEKADAIFAVSEIVSPNTKGRKGYVNKTNHPIVEGGTGYAVASGILQNKPVYVFNQDSSYGYDLGWYKWDNNLNNFVKTETPILTKNFAGIGSSTNETTQGIQAIKDVYQKTLNSLLNTQSTTPNKTIEITNVLYTKQLVKDNPNVGYVFTENNEMLGSNKNVSQTQAVIRTDEQGNKNPNALPIVTKKYQIAGATGQWVNNDRDFNKFVEVNTQLIENIKNSGYQKIVFPPGFANDKATLPTRFALWLQKALLDNFGLVTELNSAKTGLISKSVNGENTTFVQGDLFNQNTKLNAGLFTDYTEGTVRESVEKIQGSDKSLFTFNRQKLDTVKLDSIKSLYNKNSFRATTTDIDFNAEYSSFYEGFDFSNNDELLSSTLQQLWDNRANNPKDFVLGLSLQVINKLGETNSLFRRVSEKLSKLPNNGGKPIIRLLDNVSNVDDFIYTRGKSIYFNPAYFNFLSKNAPSLNSVMDRLDLLFTEEIIHLASLNLLTNQEVNDIYNELTDTLLNQNNRLNGRLLKDYTEQPITESFKDLSNSKESLQGIVREQSISELLSSLSSDKRLTFTSNKVFNQQVNEYLGDSVTNTNDITNKSLQDLWNNKETNKRDYVVGLGYYITERLTNKDSEFRRIRENIANKNNNRVDLQVISKILNENDFVYANKNKIYISLPYLAYTTRNVTSLESTLNVIDQYLLEEHIHLAALNMLTKKDEQDILNEMSNSLKNKVSNLYTKKKGVTLSDTELVHEYIRMIIQDKITGNVTETTIDYKFNTPLVNFLKKLFGSIKRIFDKLPDNSVTKQKVNSIYEELNSTIDSSITLWNQNKDVILSKNPDTTYKVFNQMYQEFGLDFINDFINKCKK